MWIRYAALLLLHVVGAVLLPSTGCAQKLEVSEIVARSARAMGGSDRLSELKALRFEVVTPGRLATAWEISRPNRVRKERAGSWMLVFDGRRTGYLEGPRREPGTAEGPHLVPEEDWRDFEMDIALYVPAYLDYAATYAGETAVDGLLAHLLRVALPLGGVAVYAVDGVMLPTLHRSPTDPQSVQELQKLEVNPVLESGRFVLPLSIR